MEQGEKHLWFTNGTTPACIDPARHRHSPQWYEGLPWKTFSSLVFSVFAGDRRHFWSTDLDLNEMKVANLLWERTGGNVESRLLLVRLLCLLAVGAHCWHISSVSDSTKLKMLGLSTDPISPWQGLRGFQRFRWKALSFLAQSYCSSVALLYNTVCSSTQ